MRHKLLRRAAAAAVTTAAVVGGLALSPAWADAGGIPHNKSATSDATPSPTTSTAAAPAATADATDTPGPGDAPPGANGTIKIERAATPTNPANASHVGCQFWVSFFGFDSGTETARLVFDGHAPTRSATLLDTTTSWTTTSRTGGNQLNTTFGPVDLMPALETAGVTPKQQGFHIKLTAIVTGSGRAATKHKVFWVEPCATKSNMAAGAASPMTAAPASPAAPTAAAVPTQVLAATVTAPSTSPEPTDTAPQSIPSDSRVAAAGAPEVAGTMLGRLGSVAGSLPLTGARITALVLLAAVLLTLGLALQRLSRRPRHHG